ncbi:MAG TPA: thioredoxin domain-containing protein [Sediminibacterium sp.]|nr:thioredoxin domain-containing protein [Sediminibacterium sp.]
MNQQTPNRLIKETSPYLRQHAYNPVDWYPWGEEARQLARETDRPMLVSIGYAACHWCHVMERESFEDPATAGIMNRYFVNIKIDREERPDLDHIYMDAVQAMTGSGGWPLHVFLTPDGRPFYGGTYFPPVRAYNRASWQETLEGVHQAYAEKRETILAQAAQLTEHLRSANSFGTGNPAPAERDQLFHPAIFDEMAKNLLAQADTEWGGFGRPPKFPQTFSIQLLLRHYHFTGHQASLTHALCSLDKMLQGGIYDQIGGGLARYSTDREWLAPHFEKMLYDNALLTGVLAEAYQLTREPAYARAIAEIADFVSRELMHPGGGFYCALDADSEGVEGKFYTWSLQEIREILGADAALFADYYDVTEKGNWEHTNILRVLQKPADFAAEKGLTEASLQALLASCRRKLFEQRSKRVRPQLDDKILLGWNALMITACCKAYAALGEERYRQTALAAYAFLHTNLQDTGQWYHSHSGSGKKIPAFLDDLAYLIQALIQLQEITGDGIFLQEAFALTRETIARFSEEETGFFYYTPEGQEDIILRKKEVYDGAVPSGNAVMAGNLQYLSLVWDMPAWAERSRHLLLQLGKTIHRYPGSFGYWAQVWVNEVYGMQEIILTGQHPALYLRPILERFLPNKILQAAETNSVDFPLLKGKGVPGPGPVAYYLCRDQTCLEPFSSADALLAKV